MFTGLRCRIAHLITLVSVALAAFGGAAIYAPAAFARVDPDGPYPYPTTMPTPSAAVTTTHLASGSGPAAWLVVVIAVALIAVGAALGQAARSVMANRQVRRLTVVAS